MAIAMVDAPDIIEFMPLMSIFGLPFIHSWMPITVVPRPITINPAITQTTAGNGIVLRNKPKMMATVMVASEEIISRNPVMVPICKIR